MNKCIYRSKHEFKIFNIKLGESSFSSEYLLLENVDPVVPFVVTEYEQENFWHNDENN